MSWLVLIPGHFELYRFKSIEGNIQLKEYIVEAKKALSVNFPKAECNL